MYYFTVNQMVPDMRLDHQGRCTVVPSDYLCNGFASSGVCALRSHALLPRITALAQRATKRREKLR